MLDINALMHALDGDGSHSPLDIKAYDQNGDGILSSRDNPFPNGSPEAKLWYLNVLQPYLAAHPIDPQAMIAAKLEVQHGLSSYSAWKVAAKIIESEK
jgi:hypothetical protein